MSTDIGWDFDDPNYKLANKTGGGGRGVGGPGPGPAGGFQSFAGGFPGMSSGGLDYGTESAANPRAALLRRIMQALMTMDRPQVDDVPANLQSGEFVVNAPATAMARPELERLNDAGSGVRRSYLNGGSVARGLETGAAAMGHPEISAAIEAIRFVSGLLGGGGQRGPNGLERARSMGYGPESFVTGGYVRNPYSRTPSASRFGKIAGGAPQSPPAPGTATGSPFVPGAGGTTPPQGANAPGTTLPTTAMDELLRRYSQSGAFDPGYGMSEIEAALNRQNQGAQDADVRDLMASGLDDPSLYASQLLASRGRRSKEASGALASARAAQYQSAQDWIRSVLSGRHQDQISEMLARIK